MNGWVDLRHFLDELPAAGRHMEHLHATGEPPEVRASFLTDLGMSLTEGARIARMLAREARIPGVPPGQWPELRALLQQLGTDVELTDRIMHDPQKTQKSEALFLSLLAGSMLASTDLTLSLLHRVRQGDSGGGSD